MPRKKVSKSYQVAIVNTKIDYVTVDACSQTEAEEIAKFMVLDENYPYKPTDIDELAVESVRQLGFSSQQS